MSRSCGPKAEPWDGNVNKSGADLLKLGSEYADLQRQLAALIEHQRRAWPGRAWTEELEAKWSLKLDPIRDRMSEIRWAAARLPAIDVDELRAKATILMDLVEHNPASVCAQLTISLCQDLIAFSKSAYLSDRNPELAERSSARSEPATVD